jgi:hypothetical protein
MATTMTHTPTTSETTVASRRLQRRPYMRIVVKLEGGTEHTRGADAASAAAADADLAYVWMPPRALEIVDVAFNVLIGCGHVETSALGPPADGGNAVGYNFAFMNASLGQPG